MRPVEFLVDTGAQHSVLKKPLGSVSKKTSWVIGATGNERYPWTTHRTIDLGTGKVTHSFLVIPECPAPLLGRDLLTEMGAQITFTPRGPLVTQGETEVTTLLTLQLEDEHRLFETSPQFIRTWLSGCISTAGVVRISRNGPGHGATSGGDRAQVLCHPDSGKTVPYGEACMGGN